MAQNNDEGALVFNFFTASERVVHNRRDSPTNDGSPGYCRSPLAVQ